MKYKIGDVARILGVSPDILRYYEKKGVVTPMKGENNDYRYYDAWDINFLMDCLWFKNFGFSIDQIADIVRIPSISELDGMLSAREEELRAVIARTQLQIKRMEEHRHDLAKIDRLLYRCEISESPEFVRFINRVGNAYDIGGGLKGLAQQWLKALPFNHRYFEMNAGGSMWTRWALRSSRRWPSSPPAGASTPSSKTAAAAAASPRACCNTPSITPTRRTSASSGPSAACCSPASWKTTCSRAISRPGCPSNDPLPPDATARCLHAQR